MDPSPTVLQPAAMATAHLGRLGRGEQGGLDPGPRLSLGFSPSSWHLTRSWPFLVFKEVLAVPDDSQVWAERTEPWWGSALAASGNSFGCLSNGQAVGFGGAGGPLPGCPHQACPSPTSRVPVGRCTHLAAAARGEQAPCDPSVSGFSSHAKGSGDGCDRPVQPRAARSEVLPAVPP